MQPIPYHANAASNHIRALIHTAPFDRGTETVESIVQEAIQAAIKQIMANVERAHFRTVEDTGANGCAMTVWNALRREVGLPYLSKDDLPAWDGKAYVQPEESKLLVKHAPVPFAPRTEADEAKSL